MFAAPLIAIAAVILVLVALLLVMRLAAHAEGDDDEGSVHAGDYVASAGRLYRIEHVRRERVLIEDCANGDLFDAGVSEVKQLPLVVPSPPVSGASR